MGGLRHLMSRARTVLVEYYEYIFDIIGLWCSYFKDESMV